MAKTGRPSKYKPDLTATICGRIAEGESLREVCRDKSMPDKTTVLRWLNEHEEFRTQYAQARVAQADHFADEILEIADDGTNDWTERRNDEGDVVAVVADHEHISRSKLRVDTRKWLMSKMMPKKYGDRVVNEIGGPDGGPIPIRDETVSETELARRLAWLLTRGDRPDNGE